MQTLADDGTGQGLYDLLDELLYLVAIDAVFADAEPGAIFRAPLEEYERPPEVPEAVHEAGLLAALGVAEMLGGRPRGAIFAVQVGDTRPGDALSPAVAKALPGLLGAVADELRGLGLAVASAPGQLGSCLRPRQGRGGIIEASRHCNGGGEVDQQGAPGYSRVPRG